MPTTNGNRKLLDLKRWEMLSPAPTASVAGSFIINGYDFNQNQMYITSATSAFLYNPYEDGWVTLASPALGGTFGAGACGASHAFSFGSSVGVSSLIPLGGSNQTIITNQNLSRDLRGYKVNIISGPNAGSTLGIVSNTIGANATIFVPTQPSAFSTFNTYRLITPRYYILNAGAQSGSSFRVYDYATNTYSSLQFLGLAPTIGTDGVLVSTPSYRDFDYIPFAVGVASTSTTNTLTNNTKNWTTNQWTNYQVRIVSGTGAGQIRTITSNFSSTLNVATWSIGLDTSSVYQIEKNDDNLFFLGNNAVTLYRYQIGINTWSIVTPGVARGAAPTTGMSANYIDSVTDADWTNESVIQNGKYIYSFRGGASALLDRYDISLGIWSNVTYSPAAETFTSGSKYVYKNNNIYAQKDATGRWLAYNLPRSAMDGWTTMYYPNGAALLGNTSFYATYNDGATEIQYIYILLNTSAIMLRQMVI